MSTPKSRHADQSSSPFQSAQRQLDSPYGQEELLTISAEQSPPLQDDFSEPRSIEDVMPAVAINDDAGSGSIYSPNSGAPNEVDPVSPSPSEGKNDTNSDVLPSRPNKHYGPPSTWRNWTTAERELTASLQQLTADDLSVHLYNAFHLKIRSRRLLGPNTKQHREVSEGVNAWIPPRVWTAWPLPPGTVPRERCNPSWEAEIVSPSHRYARSHISSHALKEILVGYVLKKARERLLARDSESEESNTSSEEQELGNEFEQSEGNRESLAASLPEDESTEPVGGPSAGPEVGDDTKGATQNANATRELEDFTSPTDNCVDQGSSDPVPDAMLDDDQASEILEPALNHVLAKLNSLLMGIHHARSAYVGPIDSASESQKDVDEPRQFYRGKRKRSRSRQTRGRPQSWDESAAGDNVDSIQGMKTTSTSRARNYRPTSSRRKTSRFRDRTSRFGLRDWSDVLGIASMTGWEAAVVGRAATRCAALFHEGISFRTLTEGRDKAAEISYLPSNSRQPEITGLDTGFSDRPGCFERTDQNEKLTGGVPDDGFFQHIEAENHWKRHNTLRQSVRPPRQSREE